MEISIIGAGMHRDSITKEASDRLCNADVIIGAPRLLGYVSTPKAEKIEASIPADMAERVRQCEHAEHVCVLLSGDTGFYSAAAKLTGMLSEYSPALYSGISSPQALASRLGRPWQDFRMVSAHGRNADILAEVLNNPQVFVLTDRKTNPKEICKQLCKAGLSAAAVHVGENLPDGPVISGTAEALSHEEFAPLSVVLIENSESFRTAAAAHGIDDRQFIRGRVPMTKREVRSVTLSMLELCSDDTVWDVGAGTGSVAVEAALIARYGRVYAVEKNPEAIGLVRQNRERFGVYNLNIAEGAAPEALIGLPAPDAVFIGGSSGSMDEILALALDRNPQVRLCVNAVTLETLTRTVDAMKSLGFKDVQASQISVSRLEPRGSVTMFTAQNPIFIISGRGGGA
jgi:precorrin-6y C5,15-methyltransferase (decarboxylating), CbiE subunit/precorrin-6Y C5,15-methyltransferase (decarboxylating), CbiT subunit